MTPEMTHLPWLGTILDGDLILSILSAGSKLLAILLTFALSSSLLGGGIYLIHFVLSLPLRRAERARLFLDLVEDALKRGQPIEAMILSVAESRDLTVGVRFHMVAAWIESGLKLGEALQKERRFLPPQITAMLAAGERLGDVKQVLPACREILRDRPASVRSAMHYLMLVVLIFSPAFIGVMIFTVVFVIPRFKDVAAGMGIRLWPITEFIFTRPDGLIIYEIVIGLLMICMVAVYAGGPGLVRWFQFRGLPLMDWIAWVIPWKRKRLQRTFSAMLAVLLDGGVPEAEAIRLAGESTANEICRRRARRIMNALEKGGKLEEAVQHFDDAGGFHWRLKNARHGRGGFLNALRGWHEALDARAFQQEEAAAHIITSGLVVLNGLMVALIATALFGMLIAVLQGMLDRV